MSTVRQGRYPRWFVHIGFHSLLKTNADIDTQALLKQRQSNNMGIGKSRFVVIGMQVPAHIVLIRHGLFDDG